MAIYTAGRRRTMVILLLTSMLLITLDLRGNAVFDAARSGFGYALRPFEIAGEVVTGPIARTWNGIANYDDVEAENERLQQQLDGLRSDRVAWQSAIEENRELKQAINLESLASYDRVTASIIGDSPNNYVQTVEIDRGSLDGIEVGMPVVNDAGLVGKVHHVSRHTSVVLLVTDTRYTVPVKVVAEIAQGPEPAVPDTVPSGIPVGDVTTTTSTTTSPTTSTLPPNAATGDAATGTATGDAATGDAATGDAATGTATGDAATEPSTSTSTTTTTIVEVTRETGALEGLGIDRLPRVRFVADSPLFGRPKVGDAVLTSGGSKSLAPPDIPVGRVANVIQKPGVEGLELEVELNANLDRLNFLTVILYQPPTELKAD